MIWWIYTETLFSLISMGVAFKNMVQNWKKKNNK